MKSNELMIGDWVTVEVPDNMPHNERVYEIMEEGISYTKDSDMLGIAFYENVKPIPLTPEILKMNRFCNVSILDNNTFEYIDYYLDASNKNRKFRLVHTLDTGKYYIYIAYNSTRIQYVHELQHILRLFGLTEMANNFEV